MAFLGVPLMLLEEYLWDRLTEFGQWVGGFPVFRDIETGLRRLSPPWAVIVLFTPAALILPVKLLAVWLMALGKVWLGLAVLICAKLTGTALVARIYTLCEPALMQVAWFVRLRDAVIRAKDWAHARLEAWPAWRLARRWFKRLSPRARGK